MEPNVLYIHSYLLRAPLSKNFRFYAVPLPSYYLLVRIKKRFGIYSKLTIKILGSGAFIANFAYFTPFSSVSIVAIEQVNVSWVPFKYTLVILRTNTTLTIFNKNHSSKSPNTTPNLLN